MKVIDFCHYRVSRALVEYDPASIIPKEFVILWPETFWPGNFSAVMKDAFFRAYDGDR